MRARPLSLTLLLTLALGLLAGPAMAAPGGEPGVGAELAQVRRATAQFHDVSAAEAAGYAQVSPCVPNMGFHYQRGLAPVGALLDPLAPEMLVYAPRPNGTLRLVAVEYAVAGDAPAPQLFGQTFAPPGPPGPPFHTLHAWVWQGNPAGVFSATNPNVSCD